MYEDCKAALVTCNADQFQQKQGEARAYEALIKLINRQPLQHTTE